MLEAELAMIPKTELMIAAKCERGNQAAAKRASNQPPIRISGNQAAAKRAPNQPPIGISGKKATAAAKWERGNQKHDSANQAVKREPREPEAAAKPKKTRGKQ